MFVELGLTSTRPHPLQQASLDIDLKRFQSSTISIQTVRGFLHPKPVRCGAEEIRNSVIDVIAVMQLSTTQLGLSCVFISSVKNSKLAVHGDMSKSSCAREFYCTCVQQKLHEHNDRCQSTSREQSCKLLSVHAQRFLK